MRWRRRRLHRILRESFEVNFNKKYLKKDFFKYFFARGNFMQGRNGARIVFPRRGFKQRELKFKMAGGRGGARPPLSANPPVSA
jgi:hypothetical protein